MVDFNVKAAADNILLQPKTKVTKKMDNDNGRFTFIENEKGNKKLMYVDRDFDGTSDDLRFSKYDDSGRLAFIYDDNGLDGTADLFARFNYNDNNSCVGSWDYDNDGVFDDYEMPNWDSENNYGRFTTITSDNNKHSTMYIDKDFDGFADETRKTFYNDDGSRERVCDDFDLDGKFDRIGYFKLDDAGNEAFAAWDNEADGTIDFYDQY